MISDTDKMYIANKIFEVDKKLVEFWFRKLKDLHFHQWWPIQEFSRERGIATC